MYNPITKNKKHLIVYFLFWILIAAIQSILLHWTQETSWFESAVEAFIYSIAFGCTGLIIWFIVRFTGLELANIMNAFTNHLAAASLLIFIWFIGSYFFTSLVLDRPLDIRKLPIAEVSWRIGLGLIYYVLVALNYYLLIFYQNFREKQVAELEMKSLLKESELSMLKAQLNPHFIFNSLNSISALTLTRPEDAHEMIVKLSTFLRHTIGQSESDLVTIQKEIETISLYLAIEKSRFGDKLLVDINGLDPLPETTKVPNLILQPLVENAVKYGVYESIETSKITINLGSVNNQLRIEIINSCEGRHSGAKGKGIGLKNVNGRLLHIYERSDLLTTSMENNHFKVTILIPQTSTDE